MPLDGKEADYTTPSTDAESVLLRAAEIIEKRGHAKRTFGRRGGPVCAIGAIIEVVFGNPQDERWITDDQIAAATVPFFQTIKAPMPAWNDDPERTAEEVVNALRAAAQHSRAEGRT